MDAATVLQGLVGSGPVALVLFYWVYSERRERRESQQHNLKMLEQTADLAETTRDALKDIRTLLGQIRDELLRDGSSRGGSDSR